MRDCLEQLAGRARLEAEIAACLEPTAHAPGRLRGWKIGRDDLQRGAYFLDTHVLVYADAADAPDKQARAAALIVNPFETSGAAPRKRGTRSR
ncbi:MAG TPA: hypothetical protein PLB41_10395 [Rubrivivax sp.]|nr:hypothetical protein [Rubrivivax sp.]HPO19954.1 hypothetical protein [Rubrivivax sp.]